MEFGLLATKNNINNLETMIFKKIFISTLFLLTTGLTFSQFTKGGSEKNYERNRVSYDSIVTERKIPISNVSHSLYAGFSVSFAKSTNEQSRMLMTQQEYMNSPYFGAPYSTGKIGLKNGFSLGFNLQTPIKAINKNLIRNIDVGLNWKWAYTSLSYDWRNIYTDQNLLFYEILNEAKYSSFKIGSFGIGPSVTIIHDPKNPIFLIDAYLRFNANIIFGGGIESIYYDGQSEYELSTYMEGTSFRLSPTLGLNFRIKNFMLFIENNFGLQVQDGSNTISFYESLTVETPYTYDYSSGMSTLSNKLKLSNVQFGIGLNF